MLSISSFAHSSMAILLLLSMYLNVKRTIAYTEKVHTITIMRDGTQNRIRNNAVGECSLRRCFYEIGMDDLLIALVSGGCDENILCSS
jgi:hypothetical protein